jgi:cystathionine beta-lyase
MQFNFDEVIERRATDSAKWRYYGEEVLPMWVADMDFRSPEVVLQALHRRVDHGVFGYGVDSPELKDTLCERMARLYRWQITPEDILFLPGLVCGINVVSRALGNLGDGVLVNTPVYPPFLSGPLNQERTLHVAELAVQTNGQRLQYGVDFDAFHTAIQPTTAFFLLCNPHNPVGRAYTQAELLRMGELCLRHNLVICSDEIHCDLLLDGTVHTPLASLDGELADRCITLMAPSKTYNLPGLGCSFAIVQNAELRKKMHKASAGIVPHLNLLGYVAANAAYRQGDDWLSALCIYLTANRNRVVEFVEHQLPNVRVTVPEATYLAWLDLRELRLTDNAQKVLLDQGKVALVGGENFGQGGAGFVRLNFGCPRVLLEEGLARIRQVLVAG